MMRKYLTLLSFLFLVSCGGEYNKNQKYIIPEGNYQIYSAKHQFQIQTVFDDLDSSYKIVLNTNKPGQRFLWRIINTEGKHYKIQSLTSGQYLSYKDSKIILSEEIDDETQLWIIHKFKDDKFKIINSSEIVCLCLPDKVYKNNDLAYRKCNNRPNEYWFIEKAIVE